MAAERLNRYLARRGVASRRGADLLIAAGRVTVNGDVSAVGTVIDPEVDVVEVDRLQPGSTALTTADPTAITIMLNKPLGVISTRHDPQQRRTVMELVEPLPGLVPVGRLDADSRGLLLLSTDGDLVHRLTHPRYGITKTYQVTVQPVPTLQQLVMLRNGVELSDGFAQPIAVRLLEHDYAAVLEIVMAEGRKREVRRLCSAVGLDTFDLKRTALGPLTLGALDEGLARRLDAAEVTQLHAAVADAMERAGDSQP